MRSPRQKVFALITALISCLSILAAYCRNRPETSLVPAVVYLATSNAPLQIFPAHTGIYILPSDRSLWIWGEVQRKVFPRAETPLKLPFPGGWRQIGPGFTSSVGIREDGTLWQWGRLPEIESNSIGRTFYYTSNPIQISTETNWVSASMDLNGWYGVALKNDGTAWGWGDNQFGTLGAERPLAFKTNYPVLISGETNWVTFIALHQMNFGLKRDGTLWAWGTPLNTLIEKPTRTSSDTNWSAVELHYARNSKGEVWALNNPAPMPDRPIAESGFLLAKNTRSRKFCYGGMGDIYMLYTIKDDGTLWATPHLVFQKAFRLNRNHQVGSRNDWVQLWSAGGACFGLTADNILWHWGHDLSVDRNTIEVSRLTKVQNEIRKLLGLPVKPDLRFPPTIKNPRPLMIFRRAESRGSRSTHPETE